MILFPLRPGIETSPRCNAGYVEKKFHGRVTLQTLKALLEDIYARPNPCTGEGGSAPVAEERS
jgi:hypothetical protein